MFEAVYRTAVKYGNFYVDFLSAAWRDITPMQYGILLVAIATFGWLLMKSGAKRC